jgi:DNA polymerase IV
MALQRKIIHIDMDAFFAAVEQRDCTDYQGRPLIVGGAPNSRGVVSTCSYEARRYGIRSAMPASHAYRLCPHAIFVRPRFEVYRQVSNDIRTIFADYSERVEPCSLDEAYLDVSAVQRSCGSATRIAQEIKQRIRRVTGLTASAGVSYNKFLAKIASDMDKPDGLYVITPEQGPGFAARLPVGRFHGIGKATEAKMHALGLKTGADLKRCSVEFLTTHFGKAGRYYYDIARGNDDRPVRGTRVSRSVGAEKTLQEDIEDKELMVRHLQDLLHDVMDRVNAKRLVARTLAIKVKYADFELVTRSKTVAMPLRMSRETLAMLSELLDKTEAGERKIRLLGVTLSSLSESENAEGPRQLELF